MIRIGVIIGLICVCSSIYAKKLYEMDVNKFREYKPFLDTIDIKKPDVDRINAAIFYVTNEVRIQRKLSPIEYCLPLERSSTLHSKDMIKYDFFSHTNSTNRIKRTPTDRAKLQGISNPYIAENIIQGFLLQYKNHTPVIEGKKGQFFDIKTRKEIKAHTYLSLAEVLVDRWMKSKGHRKNILSKDAVQLGCGAAVYTDADFNHMPSITATQNFQFYTNIQVK
ncbi:MAG: CAP domain-containing protein [Bacteroidales bacterium]|nr:CAP domain-containing protein [Bacteroidales bacterium]